MSIISLAIDASAASGTVAVLRDTSLIAEGEAVMRTGDREFLLPAVQAVLAKAGLTVSNVHRMICGSGPGSFTSLRIAGSIAKGIAHARGIPLFTVPSLALIVAERPRPEGLYVAALDAMRGEHYAVAAIVHADGIVECSSSFDLVPSAELAEYASVRRATLLRAEGGQAGPHARGAARVEARAVDVAGWEPTYGRLAEAQVRWEAHHGRPLAAS